MKARVKVTGTRDARCERCDEQARVYHFIDGSGKVRYWCKSCFDSFYTKEDE